MMRHVLVVDPWPEICRVIQLALEADGSYRVTAAGTPPAAATVLATDRPDLAIVDVVLPPVSGLKFASEAVDRGVPVLLMTAEPRTELTLENAGCPFLRKPFHLGELRASVATLLRPEEEANDQGANYGWQRFLGSLERVVAALR